MADEHGNNRLIYQINSVLLLSKGVNKKGTVINIMILVFCKEENGGVEIGQIF